MKGSIYTLRCPITDAIFYVGSTTQKLRNRLSCHMTDSKVLKHPVYEYIRLIGVSPVIELVEDVEVNNKGELYEVEKYWIDQFRQWGFLLKNVIQNKSAKKRISAKVNCELNIVTHVCVTKLVKEGILRISERRNRSMCYVAASILEAYVKKYSKK